MVACATTSTTTTYTPITGIVIRSSVLVAGFGCGIGVNQVYRYVAVVRDATSADAEPDAQAGALVSTNISECFSDAVFENLPVSSSGSQAFAVSVFAYDKKSYDDALLPNDLACPPGMPADGATCVDGSESVTAAQEGMATWTTICTATQQEGAPVLAVCPPLEPPNVPPDAATDAGVGAEAGAPDARSEASATDTGTDG